jgi:2-polyprenyl-3-methyl-5-hydroxy-6-metoxy-1,4-benzoquinol methylase
MNEGRRLDFKPHEIDWDAEKSQRLWEYYGSSKAHRVSYFGESVGRHFVRVLKRYGLFRDATAIVDFSCGTGAIISSILRVAKRDATVRGYDPSIQSVNRANDRNRGIGGFAGAYPATEYPTDLGDESVNLLILTEVIEHLDEKSLDAVLLECRRILAPNGTIVITTPNSEDLAASKVLCPECGCIFHRWQHMRSWSAETLGALVRRYEFENIRTKQIMWGNELVDLAFSLLNRKKTGLMLIATRGR